MGILNIVEEVVGAVVAEKALGAVDPNAGILEEAAAAVAGYEGVSKVKEYLNQPEQAPAPAADNSQVDPNQFDPNTAA